MSDEELQLVMTFTKGVPQQSRALFLETLGRILSTSGDCGPDVVSRALMAAQRDTIGPRLQTTFLIR